MILEINSLGRQSSDALVRLPIVLLRIHVTLEHGISTLALSLTELALLIEAQLLFEHETGHLDAFKAVERGVWLVLIECLLVSGSLALVTRSCLVVE